MPPAGLHRADAIRNLRSNPGQRSHLLCNTG